MGLYSINYENQSDKHIHLLAILGMYGIAIIGSLIISSKLTIFIENNILITLTATIIATMIIFIFSLIFSNVSIYDPYWSIQPIAIAIYWFILSSDGVNTTRQILLLFVISIWGTRLTLNWIKGWKGFEHEDWRYVKYRKENQKFVFLFIAFFGLELMPTILVFIALVPIFPALVFSDTSIGFLDFLGAGIALSATVIEYIADEQMREFRANNPDTDKVMTTGLWAYSRHPNYFGEISFWVGLYLIGLSANIEWWWTIIGPIVMILLFVFISIPLMEKRQVSRKAEYQEYQRNVSMLIPWK